MKAIQVSIDTNDQQAHPAYSVVGLHPRQKQVVAQRLAVAGLRVAYGNLTYPTGGPIPVNITRQGGQVTVRYDQEVRFIHTFLFVQEINLFHFNLDWQVVFNGSGGFSVCLRLAHLCDATLSLKNWQSVPPDRVVQESI